MALPWCSFVEAVTPGHDWSGQGGSGHHNCMVGGHPLSHKPADGCVRRDMLQVKLQSLKGTGWPQCDTQKTSHQVKGEESESEDEEEFEDSRENLPPKDPVEPSSTHEWVPLPINAIHSSQPSLSLSSLPGPTSQAVIGQDITGEGRHEGDLDHTDFIEDAKFYQDAALDYQNTYEAYMCSK